MTITVWPADAVAGAPSYTGRMLRQSIGALWTPAGSARPLGAMSGVRVGSGSAYVAATSTTWTVHPHSGVLDVEASAVAGPYNYAVGADVTGAMNAADATNPRIDLISVQLSDPAEGDGTTTPGVAVVYTVGTPAATPVAPATPARSTVLAQLAVPKVGGGSPAVTIVAASAVAAGGILPAAVANAPGSPYVGQYIDDPSLGLLRWNGTAWLPASSVAYSYSGTTLAGALYNPALPVHVAVARLSGTTDVNGLFTRAVSGAVSVLTAMATFEGTSSTNYWFKVRTDLTSLTSVAFQMYSASATPAASTAYIASARIEYQ